MADQYGNKTTDELVQDSEVINASASVESNIEAALWALEPESRKIFADITKDLATANLNMTDLKHVRRYVDLSFLYGKLGQSEDCLFFIRKAYVICTTSLSFQGFGIKSVNTSRKEIGFQGTPQKPNSQTPGARKFLGFIPY